MIRPSLRCSFVCLAVFLAWSWPWVCGVVVMIAWESKEIRKENKEIRNCSNTCHDRSLSHVMSFLFLYVFVRHRLHSHSQCSIRVCACLWFSRSLALWFSILYLRTIPVSHSSSCAHSSTTHHLSEPVIYLHTYIPTYLRIHQHLSSVISFHFSMASCFLMFCCCLLLSACFSVFVRVLYRPCYCTVSRLLAPSSSLVF